MNEYAPRRPLADVLVELADAMGGAGDFRAAIVRATSLELSLPIEAGVEQRDGALQFIADLPRFHRRTDFDRPPGRLTVTLCAEAVSS